MNSEDRYGGGHRVGVLVVLLAIAASAALAGTAGGMLEGMRATPGAAAAFLGLVLFLQLFSVDVYGRGSIGVSAIGMLATGFLLGPGPAMAIAAAAAVAQGARKRSRFHRTVFNAANFALSAGAGSFAYEGLSAAGDSTVLLIAAANLAGLAFTGVNNGLLCLAMSLSESLPFRAVWRERFNWARFHFLAFGPLALATALAYDKIGIVAVLAFALPPALVAFSVRQYVEHTRAAVEDVRRANTDLMQANAELRRMADRLRKTRRDTIAALSRSMEAKDHDTGDHTERVARIAVTIAERLGYAGEDLEAIEIGALLHDIGKIGVPERILLKPAPLDADEWRLIRTHPLISELIVAEVEFHPFVCQIARSSHERFDGAGYPDGLEGETIPLPARIVLVADSLDAMTSDRPYRSRRTVTEALFELRYHAGTQFCPRVVAALEQVHRDEPGFLGRSADAVREAA